MHVQVHARDNVFGMIGAMFCMAFSAHHEAEFGPKLGPGSLSWKMDLLRDNSVNGIRRVPQRGDGDF